MVEIYSHDISSHERYAHDQNLIEDFQKAYHLPPSAAGIVAVQTRILDMNPKLPAIVMLMQTNQRKMWAGFSIPAHFYTQRAKSSYVAPSLGSAEKQDADVQRLLAIIAEHGGDQESGGKEEEEEDTPKREGEILIELLEKGIKETNEMVDFVISRMNQFVQG
ncbi:MAG: DUF5399 family protein [Chlamydiales bacterium]